MVAPLTASCVTGSAHHLMAENGEFVHGHFGLVSSIDAFMPDQSGGRDHVRRHAIADEENHIFGSLHLGQRSHQPLGHGGRFAVIGQGGHVVARLVEGHPSV